MKILGLILLIAMMISCGQSPSPISKSRNQKFYISKNSKSCKEVNLYKDIFLKSNILNLLQCLDYDKKYPTIFEAINKEDSLNFISINETLNQSFLKDTNTRNLLFGLVVSKTKKESSMSLSHLVKSFLEQTSNLEALQEMTLSLKKNDTKVSVNFLFSYLEFMAGLDQSTEVQRKKLNLSLGDVINKKSFSNFLEVFFKDILIDDGLEKSAFISFLDNGEWLDNLMDEIDLNSFDRIINFVSSNEDFQKGIYKYQEAIETDSYDCSLQSKSYVVDHSVELKWQLENLYKLNKTDFEFEMINLMTRFNLYSQICYDDKFIPSTQKLLSKFVSFIQIDGGFTILKNFAKLSVTSGFDYRTLINFFTSGSFNELKPILDSLKDNPSFKEAVFRLVRSLNPKDYRNINSILKALQSDKIFLSSISKLWNERLSKETKDSLIGYVVDMFLTQEDIYPAFDLLNVIVSNLPKESELLFNDILFDSNNNLQSILSEFINNPKLQSEVLDFLDDNSLFELLSIIQKSTPVYIEKEDVFKVEESLFSKKENKNSDCLKYLSNIDTKDPMEHLINNYPAYCLGTENKDENFALKIIRWSQFINSDFSDLFGNSFTSVNGILYKDSMHFLHQMVHVTTKFIKSAEDFSKETVNSVKDYFFKFNNIEKLEQGIKNLISLEVRDQTVTKVLNKTKEIRPEQFDETLKYVFNLLSTYSSKSVTYNCLQSESCNVDMKNLSATLSQNNLKIDKTVLQKVIRELGLGVYSPEDYIELIRFMGENNAYKAIAFEKILKAVDFSNGYYAAFFLSKLSKSNNYTKTIATLKKDFKLANKFSGTFRFFKFFPTDIKKRFEIVMDNIDVLKEFDQTLPGQNFKYGDILIQLSKALTNLSPRRTQNLVKVSIPRSKKVFGHYSHYLLALSQKGYLSELCNYVAQNLDQVKSRNLDFKIINEAIQSIEVQIDTDNFNLDILPVNKSLMNTLLSIPLSVQSTLLSYIKLMPNLTFSSEDNQIISLNEYNKLFRILSDKDVDYHSLHRSLMRVHSSNPEYINQLLEYSIYQNNNKSNIKVALENMFVDSNESLILFFKDILAHFQLK